MFSLFQVQVKSRACTGLFSRIVWLYHPHAEWTASYRWPPTILCLLPTEAFLCNWWQEEFSPGDVPCWSSAPSLSCCSWGRIHGPTHPYATTPVSLQSSHPQTLQVLVSPLSVPFPLFWCLCSSTTQHEVFCPQGGRAFCRAQLSVHLPNSRVSCSACTSPSAVPVGQVRAEAGYWQWYEQWAMLNILHVI